MSTNPFFGGAGAVRRGRLKLCAIAAGLVYGTLASCGYGVAEDGPTSAGPLVGHTTAESVTIWARCADAGAHSLVMRDAVSGKEFRATAEAREEDDLTVRWQVDGLLPQREYVYQVRREADGATYPEYEVRTGPEDDSPGAVRIAFCSCADEDEGTATAWRAMREEAPEVVVLLGDTPYIDSAELSVQRRRYREFASFEPMAELLRTTPWYGTWDDHDFGRNDTDGRLEGKEQSRQAFIEYHAQKQYGEADEGIYTRFRRGAVEVFLLDTRYFAGTAASPVDANAKTLLGARQWEWLRRGLKTSTATFKVLASGMIWNEATRPNKTDHWMHYPHERDGVLKMIGELGVSGVVLVGGDIHRSRVLRHSCAELAGYDVPELITSPMHNSIIERANAPHEDLIWDSGVGHTFLILQTTLVEGVPHLLAHFVAAAEGRVFSVPYGLDELTAR